MTHAAVCDDTAAAGELPVERGRDAYLAENGFTLAAYDAKWTPASLFGINFSVPNTARHRRAIMWHDLHHVATGFGTDPAGEGEISAWELRRGLRGLDLYVKSLVIMGALLGLVIAPRRVYRAWVLSGRAGGSLFPRESAEYPRILAMSVAELRAVLAVPVDGLAIERGLHSTAPSRL